MARFHFLDDGFTGRLGTLVGSRYDGELYVKRYHKPGNPSTEDQMEVRALFREITGIGFQIRPELALLNRPHVKHNHLVNHLVHINTLMFDKNITRSSGQPIWGTWHPEMFQLCMGTMNPITLEKAEIVQTQFPSAGLTLNELHVSWPIVNLPANEGFLVVYDDDCKRVITQKVLINQMKGGQGNETWNATVDLSPFANMTSWQNIHVYMAYVDGKFADKTVNPLHVGRYASKTSYIHAVMKAVNPGPSPYTPNNVAPAPQPAPAPLPAAHGMDEGTQTADPVEAAALRDEAARLMAEAQRLEAQASAAGGPAA